ncbi:MAG: hypothetical protein ACRC2Y_04895 [Aeromonas veronii]
MARVKKEVISTWEGMAEIPKGAVGFVYEIRNKATGKRYIGMKNFYCVRAGKKAESDWKTYQGSNKLVADWAKEDIEKEVLQVCKTKFEMSYTEIKYLIDRDALLRRDYENYMVGSQTIGRAPAYMMKG